MRGERGPPEGQQPIRPTQRAGIHGGSSGFEPEVYATGMGNSETVDAILEALTQVSFPVTRDQLCAQVGANSIPFPHEDKAVPMSEMLAQLPPTTFQNAREVKDALWNQMEPHRGGPISPHEETTTKPREP